MAFGTPVAGAAAYSALNATSVAPAYPAGVVATDQLILVVGMKPGTANGGTVTTPTGWTLRDSLTGAGGYGTTLTADAGNTNLWVFTKNTVLGTETGNLTVTLGANNITWAFIVRVPTAGGTVSYGSSDGQDTNGGNVSVTLAANPGLEAGDFLLWAMCIPTDVTTPAQFSAHAITATGATFATPTEINEPDSGTGNDIGGFSAYTTVSSGTASVAPTITATAGGTTTNVRGPLVLLRLRESAAPNTLTQTTRLDNASTFYTPLIQVDQSLAPSTFSNANQFYAAAVLKQVFPASVQVSFVEFDTAYVVSAQTLNPARLDNVNTFYSPELTIARVGTMAAAEQGQDTLSATGRVRVAGSLNAAETGADSFSATGDVIVNGSLASTEVGQDAFAAAGRVIVRGALAASETGADTLTASGKVFVRGSLAAAEAGADAFNSAGRVIVSGSLAATESTDTLSASGRVLVSGSLAVTESGNDVFVGTGGAESAGILAATEQGNDTLTASGAVSIAGALTASETGADALAATGSVRVAGSLSAAEVGSDTFAATGGAFVSGSLIATEVGQDSLSASGRVRVAGSLAASEVGADTLAATGRVRVAGSLAAAEAGADTLAATGRVRVAGSLAAAEAGTDTFTAAGSVTTASTSGSLSAQEAGADAMAAAGRVLLRGSLDAQEAADSISASGKILIRGQLIGAEASDSFAGTGGALDVATGSFAVTEAADTFGDYVAPGYVQPGYFGGVTGTVGAAFSITGAQALLLKRLHQLHGLADPLQVSQTSRQAGDLQQLITESGGSITISTIAGNATVSGFIGQMIEELAALHGLTTDVTVTPTSRTAGAIVQSFATSGATTTVTRQ